MTPPKIICLTPIKNEAWILDRFLKCASLWADHIIIADHSSDDGSREIALKYPKVILIDDPAITFNESERQKLLLEEARKISGSRLLIALDADEMLTANFLGSPEWQTILNAKPGTVVGFQWINIRPDLTSYWSPDYHFPLGFMDDGSEHIGTKIHSPRIPIPVQAPMITLRDIKVLHYQYTDWERMKSKHRWYQCWERLNNPKRRAVDIYRQYHHMYAIPSNEIQKLRAEWFSGYEQHDIDMTSTYKEKIYRWDREVLALFAEHGLTKFKREAIWDVNWSEIFNKINQDTSASLKDPRNIIEKYIYHWLRKTQPDVSKLYVKLGDFVLRFLGW